jgi:hypothetical protein
VLPFEEAAHRSLFVRIVDADRHELEGPLAVHPVGVLQVGELLRAGRAPGRPEVDEQRLAGRVLPKRLDPGGVDLLERHRLLVDGVELGVVQRGLVEPFDRAADRRRLLDRDRAT